MGVQLVEFAGLLYKVLDRRDGGTRGELLLIRRHKRRGRWVEAKQCRFWKPPADRSTATDGGR